MDWKLSQEMALEMGVNLSQQGVAGETETDEKALGSEDSIKLKTAQHSVERKRREAVGVEGYEGCMVETDEGTLDMRKQ